MSSKPVSLIILGAGGRMGSLIARLAQENPNFHLAAVVEKDMQRMPVHSSATLHSTNLEDILPQMPDAVIIDFTTPQASLAAAACKQAYGNPHVIGTTGFNGEEQAILADLAKKTPILWSANMSVGITVLLKLLPELVRLLGDQYDFELLEIHHKNKKDAPSGTALRLAECVAAAKGWSLRETGRYNRTGLTGERKHNEIGMQSLRGGDVAGIHTLYCLGCGERIEITHEAVSRENFAAGALRAARWMADKEPGKLYTMLDVLQMSE